MNKRKNLKGFTLVELIIVMAIFGILMTAIMQIIDPLDKLSRRASIQEANSAAVDNIKTYFEGTLRYADCIEVCNGGLTDNYDVLFANDPGAAKPSDVGSVESKAVINFINNHYTNRFDEKNEQLKGKVYMLKIDNANGGHVSEYKWDFTAGYTYTEYDEDGEELSQPSRVNASISNFKETTDVINSVYYRDYSFFITPGFNEMVTQSDSGGLATSDDAKSVYYASVEKKLKPDGTPYDYKLKDMFSMSVIVYRNDTDEDGASLYRGDILKADGTKEKDVFKSPFALSNINMSLVNIKSEFAKNRTADLWGLERREGKPKDDPNTYNHNTPVTENGKTLYRKIESSDAPKIDEKIYPHNPVPNPEDSDDKRVSDDCIYFIYTLPDYK